jgi:class 3 adenylate cyclase
MTVYMDRHEGFTATPREIAEAHLKDIEIQDKYGVKFITYWVDWNSDQAFCLVDAPSKEAAAATHREAHGGVANTIMEVDRSVVESFMGIIADTPAAIDPATTDMQPALRIILFTDMEASTATTQRLGDAKAMELLRTHDGMIRDALQTHGGREVKHTGDGIMASFVSASAAIEGAITIQRSFATYNEGTPEVPIRVRIGLTAGEPVVEHEDLFGVAVILARRICDSAEPNEILVANVVRELCIGKDVRFVDRALATLKGFDDPVQVYSVTWSS